LLKCQAELGYGNKFYLKEQPTDNAWLFRLGHLTDICKNESSEVVISKKTIQKNLTSDSICIFKGKLEFLKTLILRA
jgi:hypothetical protein